MSATDETPLQRATIALSLIAHTNAGKTTLARTLLGRDVGTVRDAQHVTQEATQYTLAETSNGDVLALWDTPGFGDSTRLARRLSQQGNPLGWLLSQAWDRFRDRALFLAQQLARNVRDQADVVLYLVNASESPADAGYVLPELDILTWIGKPVVVVLNQTGPPRPHDEDAAEVERWRDVLATTPIVRAVTTFDAFARCWVQEGTLFAIVGRVLPASRQPAYQRLVQAWQARRAVQFDAAMAALAAPIAAASVDTVQLPAGSRDGVLRAVGQRLGIGAGEQARARDDGARAMAQRLEDALRSSTEQVIGLYALDGQVPREALADLDRTVTLDAPVSEARAAMMGGVVSGALTGLAADLAAGGLTLGAGLVAGAVVGALGGAGVARSVNLARNHQDTSVRWTDAFLTSVVRSALLRYLAVAHFGRGRGAWTPGPVPAFWSATVDAVIADHAAAFALLWQRRSKTATQGDLAPAVEQTLGKVTTEVLQRLYPDWRPASGSVDSRAGTLRDDVDEA